MAYVGRFAPSPTGPLHFGSLVAALASYLDAKAHSGKWLVRIEDLDTARCQPEATNQILNTLHAHGMCADGELLFQSSRHSAYSRVINTLLEKKHAYFCQCTRKQIKAQGGVHLSECRLRKSKDGAIRFCIDEPVTSFHDRLQEYVEINDAHALEDFVIQRRDSIYAYNLAVVLDDIMQNVTHIVRGEDLLTTTSAHLSFYHYLDKAPPTYMHIPVIKDGNGNKLSKQNHAPAINDTTPEDNLIAACHALNIDISLQNSEKSVDKILGNAIQAWQERWASSKLAHLN